MTETSLAEVLSKNHCLTLTAKNKILCSITGHEMPPRLDAVLSHLHGKKFKKANEWYNYDYSEFLPHVVLDRENKLKLHCKLTGQTLNKIPDEVKKHVHGKKFLRLKKEFEEKKAAKKDEKEDEDSDIGSDIWVPPDELVYSDDEGIAKVPAKSTKKVDNKAKVSSKVEKVVEEDTMSDLAGSDHEDEEFDIEVVEDEEEEEARDEDEYDFSAMEVDAIDTAEDDEDEEVEEEEEVAPAQKRKSASIVNKKPAKMPKISIEATLKPREKSSGLQKKPAAVLKEKLHSKTTSMLKSGGRRS